MSEDRRKLKRTSDHDRRQGSRVVVITGPRSDIDHVMPFYRNIGQLHMAFGFEESFVLDSRDNPAVHVGEQEVVPPDKVLQNLRETLGPNSMMVADLTAPSAQVLSDLLFARALDVQLIILRNEGQAIPILPTEERVNEEVLCISVQETVNSTISQLSRAIYIITSRQAETFRKLNQTRI